MVTLTAAEDIFEAFEDTFCDDNESQFVTMADFDDYDE